MPAGQVNEDALGHGQRTLWVLDGATGVSQYNCTPGPTDAAWFARHAARQLSAISEKHQCLESMLVELQMVLRTEFEAGCTRPNVNDRDMPTSCLALARLDAHSGRLDVACIGDIAILVAQPDGTVTHYTDDAARMFGDRTLRAWRAAREVSDRPEHWWSSTRQTILANREMVNRPDGYWVLHPRRLWLEGVQYFSVPVVVGTRLMMASDGMYRLVDLFGHFDNKQLIHEAFNTGLDGLCSRLRASEQADAQCEHFARVKVSDDATAVLATVTTATESV